MSILVDAAVLAAVVALIVVAAKKFLPSLEAKVASDAKELDGWFHKEVDGEPKPVEAAPAPVAAAPAPEAPAPVEATPAPPPVA